MKSKIHEIQNTTNNIMSKKIVLAIIAVITLIACNKEGASDANVHISGDVKGLSQGKLYLQKIQDSALVMLDSIEISGDSKFKSHIKLESPEMLYLFLDRGQTNSIDNSLPFFAEPGEIKIETTLKHFFADAKITGSKNHDLWKKFDSLNSKFRDQNLALMAKRLKNEYQPNPTTTDSIEKAYNNLLKRKYRYTAHFAVTNANKEIAPYLALSEIADINTVYLDTIQKSMTPEVAKSKYGKMLKEYVKERKALEAQK
ncbi:uncharacterized protein DUF4369 [Flavobacterium aquaticum]|uniref:Uncharacterized protein DUF4369 n=1 Tax=Flavobacterium aquaticum TaxID=1236486 RepID=A0A327YSE8_9FLAO|nr:DUF4369 domain-containing protein [Flavobacterium aquaticum]RAK22635.1 uncharacterized protein DUF4369 [Flavobacterium aquaticum]